MLEFRKVMESPDLNAIQERIKKQKMKSYRVTLFEQHEDGKQYYVRDVKLE